jgi:hypothetical protein
MIVTEMRSAHVPVEVLGFQIHGEYIREDGIHRVLDLVGCLLGKIARGAQ